MNIPIFVIGVGTAVNKKDVVKVAGSEDNVFIIKNIKSFEEKQVPQHVVAQTCKHIRKYLICLKVHSVLC